MILDIKLETYVDEDITMYFDGIIVGAITFLIIGIFHPIVIKTEYHFTAKVWPIYLVFGILCLSSSIFLNQVYIRIIVCVLGCSALWGIGELKEQKARVEKGWFPKNPKK